MQIVVLVALAILLIFVGLGAGRAETSRPRRIAWPIGMALLAALVCYLIGENKTGSFLEGIVGVLGAIVLLIAAGGLALGWLALQAARGFNVTPRRVWATAWDMVTVCLLGFVLICFAVVE